ncbi:protein kinase, partial [Kitasatospora sp. MBT66]
EQARDSRGVTGASDVFSLGSLLVFCATGHPPYRGANPVETVFQLLREQPDLSGLPAELVDLVRACMRPAPEHRPTPEQIQVELAPHLFSRDDASGEAGDWLPPNALALIEQKRRRPAPAAQPPVAQPPVAQPPAVPPQPHLQHGAGHGSAPHSVLPPVPRPGQDDPR